MPRLPCLLLIAVLAAPSSAPAGRGDSSSQRLQNVLYARIPALHPSVRSLTSCATSPCGSRAMPPIDRWWPS